MNRSSTHFYPLLPVFLPMSAPQKTPSGSWRIQVFYKGARDAATFPTQREARAWADARRTELRAAAEGGAVAAKIRGEAFNLNDAMKKYGEEVSPEKRGARWELLRIEAITTKHPHWPGKRRMAELDAQDLIQWRDARLKAVSKGTVLREIALVSHVLDTARQDWGWITSNPMADVRRPKTPDHRERIIAGPEIRAMLRQLEWTRGRRATTTKHAVAHCFIAALQTGMRASEIANLEWDDVRDSFCILHTGRTKTGKGRQVPLTHAARRNIEMMRGFHDVLVFGVEAASLDALFRRHRAKAELDGFTFHDTRHTAATRMAQVLHVLDLCKAFGWTDTKRALTYYNPTGSDIAARLNAGRAATPIQ
ncbi:integrase family protein [Comamonas thiooxydans]|nr:integrase family protein [Comamonas thiooxydans]